MDIDIIKVELLRLRVAASLAAPVSSRDFWDKKKLSSSGSVWIPGFRRLCLLGSRNWDFILTPKRRSEYVSEWRGVEGPSSSIHNPPAELQLASRHGKAVVTRQGLCGTRIKPQPTVPLSGSAMLEKLLTSLSITFSGCKMGIITVNLYID